MEQATMFPHESNAAVSADLNGKIADIFECMKDGQWRTLTWLEKQVGMTGSGTSAALRSLRKPKYGGHTVERRYVGGRLYEYRLIV